eukprot:scaffold130281_cov60-Phaeocystis_antarctica.AAC.1
MFGLRQGALPLLREDDGEVVVGLGIVRLELDRLLPRGRRARLVSLREAHGRHVVVDGRQRRVDRQDLGVVLERRRQVVRLVRGDG